MPRRSVVSQYHFAPLLGEIALLLDVAVYKLRELTRLSLWGYQSIVAFLGRLT